MLSSVRKNITTHLNVYSLIVPIAAIIANFFPLRPIIQQALVGIVLVWLDIEILLGFPFWRT